MFKDFGIYLLSFLDKWLFWVGIIMLIADILEKRWPRFKAWTEKWAPRWAFGVVALLLLILASFQVWHEEHAKVLSQVTYMSLKQDNTAPSHVEFTDGSAPYIGLLKSNDGDNLAIDVTGIGALEIQDFSKPVDLDTFPSSPEIENALFEKLQKRFPPSAQIKKTYEPHEKDIIFANLGRRLTPDEASGLNNRTKILYLVGYVDWSDGSGRHEEQICQWIKEVGREGWSAGCQTHNGLIKIFKRQQ
jgi:hypothetical protein